VEKAHPDVFNILLQILEDGHLSDSQGRVVSFKNTLVVMTSNVGSQQIAKGGGGGLGFQLNEDADGGRYANIKALVTDELKNFFRPELLNRLDEIVVFKQLEREEVRVIADIMLRETAGRLAERGITLELTDSAMDYLLAQGFDQEYGARPMRRAVTSLVLDNLSEMLLKDELAAGDTACMYIDVHTERLSVTRVNESRPLSLYDLDAKPNIAFSSADQVAAAEALNITLDA
jgi:ATP-dependent Clp protease ATP-binding subunit ClpC